MWLHLNFEPFEKQGDSFIRNLKRIVFDFPQQRETILLAENQSFWWNLQCEIVEKSFDLEWKPTPANYFQGFFLINLERVIKPIFEMKILDFMQFFFENCF